MKLNEQIKVICFDYDGTLVDSNCVMSSYTKECLYKLKEKGYKIALVSGRPVQMAKNVISNNLDYHIFDFFFGNNGSEFYIENENRTELSVKFSRKEIIRLYNQFKNDLIMIVAYINNDFMYDHEYEGSNLEELLRKRKMNPVKIDFNLFNFDCPKLVLFSNEDKRKEVDEFIKTINDDSIDIYRSANTLIEIVPKGCGKHLAINKLTNILNISKDEIMAVGDNDNDISMLEECVGVAMKNATDKAKSVSKYIAGDVNDKGIYSFFKKEKFID